MKERPPEQVAALLNMDPIERAAQEGTRPLGLFLQVLLVIFTTILAINVSRLYNANERAQLHQFKTVLLNTQEREQKFHTLTQFIDHLQDVKTFLLQRQSQVFFQDSDLSQVRASFLLDYQKKGGRDSQVLVDLDSPFMGPFLLSEPKQVKQEWQALNSAILQLDQLQLTLKDGRAHYSAIWNVHLHYSWHQMGSIVGSLVALRVHHHSSADQQPSMRYDSIYLGQHESGISYCILVMASLSLILNIRYAFQTIDLFTQCRLHVQQKRLTPLGADLDTRKQNNLTDLLVSRKPWASLSLSEKMLLLDSWLLVSTFAHLVQVQMAVMSLQSNGNYRSQSVDRLEENIYGLGVFLSFISCVKYLGLFQEGRDRMTKSLWGVFRWLSRFCVGFFPIFLAYVFIGMCVFHEYVHFSSFSRTVSTLFSLMVADSVQMITQDMVRLNPLTQIYLMSYIFIFFIIVHSIFVALICDKFKTFTEKVKKDQEASFSLEDMTISRQNSPPLPSPRKNRMSKILNDAIRLDHESVLKGAALNEKEKRREWQGLGQLLNEEETIQSMVLNSQKGVEGEALERKYCWLSARCQHFNRVVDNVHRTVQDQFEFQLRHPQYSCVLQHYYIFMEETVLAKVQGLLRTIQVKSNFLRYWEGLRH